MNPKSRTHLRILTSAAMLAAVASFLQFFELAVPLMPPIVKLEFSDLPALIAAFTLGPVAGVAVELIKNCVHLFFTWSAGIGELCNFLLGACLVLPAGLLYRRYPTFKGAVLASCVGAFAMALGSLPVNYIISYPFYAAFMMPMDVILDMYRAINPNVQSLWQALLWFNVPFTLCKAFIAVVLTLPVYKRLMPVLRGRGLTQ